MYETTHPSLTLASSSPTNQTMPSVYNRIDSFSSSMTTLHHLIPNQNNSSMMNLLHYSRDTNPNNNNSTITQISSKGDHDGYGFLWNMDLEENSLEDGVASNLDAIRFEVDNNNMVLL